MAEQEYYWNKLENAAKIFPAVRSEDNTSVYRVAAKLRENVEPVALQTAVERALSELPAFRVKLRRGFFWYYWESNDLNPVVQEDREYPLRPMDKRQNNGYFFRTTYLGRKINLEIFHALTDGTGAMILLKSILYHYLKIRYPGVITKNELISETGFSQHALEEDAYQRLKRNVGEKRAVRHNTAAAYQLRGERYLSGRVDVTQGMVSVPEIVTLAKQAGTTVTVYVTALLVYSIYETTYKFHAEKKPITIAVPVNLRGFIESSTVRNFFTFITVSVNFWQNPLTLEQVQAEVSRQLKAALDEKSIFDNISYHMRAERNLAIRFIPLFLKNWILRGIYTLEECSYTSTVSNLGQVNLPKEQQPFIERCESLNNITKRQCFKMCLCSSGGVMTFSFVSGMADKDVERYFFRFFTENGVHVQIASNEVQV